MITSKAVSNKINRDFIFKLSYEEKENEYGLIYEDTAKGEKKDKIISNLKPNQTSELKNDLDVKNFLIDNISKYYESNYNHSKNDYAENIADVLIDKLGEEVKKSEELKKKENQGDKKKSKNMLGFKDVERETIRDFIKEHYYDEIMGILENQITNIYDYGLEIDFKLLNKYNEGITLKLLNNPSETIKKFDNIINKIVDDEGMEKVTIFSRFINTNNMVEFHKIGKDFLNQLITTKAVIKSAGAKKPYKKEQIYVCSDCGLLHTAPIDNEPPTRCIFCGCKHLKPKDDPKGYGNLIEVILQEPLTESGARTPAEYVAYLRDDLLNVDSNNSMVGQVALISGIVKIRHLEHSNDYYIDIHNIQLLNDESNTFKISQEDQENIKNLSQRDDIIELLCDSLLPHYVGEDYIKLACLCYMLGAGYLENTRRTINILIIGDPGTSKTKIKERLNDLSYKSVCASGESSSKVGLTYAVVKDKLSKNWTLEAGAIVLASNGHCFIDEFDKISKDDLDGFNTALESNKIEVNKAGINTVLIAKTSVMCFGNPKYKRYDPYKSVTENINVPSDVLDRFDLKIILEDKPSQKDEEIANALLDSLMGVHNDKKEFIDTSLLKKYLFKASKLEPKLTEAARAEIMRHWMKCRGYKTEELTEDLEHYNSRNFNSVIRLSGAIAKAQFKEEIGKNEIQKAIELELDTLRKIGYDPTTNTIDIDKVNGGSTSNDKKNRELIKQRLKELQEEKGESIRKSELTNNCYKNENTKFIGKTTFYNRYNELIKNGEIKENGKGSNPTIELC